MSRPHASSLTCALLALVATSIACSSTGSERDASPAPTPRDGSIIVADAAAPLDAAEVAMDAAADPIDAAAPMDAAAPDATIATNGQFGEACIGGATCAGTLSCIKASSNRPGGFCTQECNVIDMPCPAAPAGAACVLANETATGSLCAWMCNGVGSACPPGLVCQPTGGAGPWFCQ